MSQQNNEKLEISGSIPKLPFIIVTIVFIGMFGGFYWLKHYGQGQAPAWQPHAVPVTAMKVEPISLPTSLQAIGSLTAVQQVVVSSEIAGRIAAIHFQSGDKVKASQVLLQQSDDPKKASLLSAKANVQLADSQLKRSEKLAKSGVDPLAKLQIYRAQYQQAAAEVVRIQSELDQAQIKAPFSGVLGIRDVNLGQYLNPGEPVVTLTSLDKLYVQFSLPQQSLDAIRIGAKVVLTTNVYPDRQFEAHVNAIEPQVDSETRNISVQATLDNSDRALYPGMFVSAALALPVKKDVLLVPSTAVQTSAQGYSMVVISGNDAEHKGVAKTISVKVGDHIGNNIEVTSGLNAGDTIVTLGQNRIQPGAQLVVAQLVKGEGR